MECFEKGLLTSDDTGGLELFFGNEKVLPEIIEQIAFKKGFGALLAEGSREAVLKKLSLGWLLGND